jgi:hydrogenase maturation protease
MEIEAKDSVLKMKTIVVGLGNPILGDDGVGWKVAEEVQKQLPSPQVPRRSAIRVEWNAAKPKGERMAVDVEFLSLGGISLMEHLIGYQRAILVDAIKSDREIGSVVVVNLSEMPDYSAFHIASAHDTSLQNALKLGKSMGVSLPKEVIVIGIATDHVYDFSESLSPPVAGAVSRAAKIVINLL